LFIARSYPPPLGPIGVQQLPPQIIHIHHGTPQASPYAGPQALPYVAPQISPYVPPQASPYVQGSVHRLPPRPSSGYFTPDPRAHPRSQPGYQEDTRRRSSSSHLGGGHNPRRSSTGSCEYTGGSARREGFLPVYPGEDQTRQAGTVGSGGSYTYPHPHPPLVSRERSGSVGSHRSRVRSREVGESDLDRERQAWRESNKNAQ
jgi:hypothetical protein